MRFLLFLLLAAPAAASNNVFPEEVTDVPISRDLDFLYDEITRLRLNPTTTVAGSTSTVSTATVITNPAGYVPNSQIDPSSVTKQGFVTLSNLTGTAALASNVTTNANLTGPVTSVGNATTIVGPVPPAAVDLSTVTSGLNLRVLKAGDTMTGTLIGTHVAVSSVVAGFTVGIGSAVPTQALVVVGSTTVSGEMMVRGSTAWGRVTAAPLGAISNSVDISWNGHSAATRDNASVMGGHFNIGDGGLMLWGGDTFTQMAFQPGADEQGHLAIGWGNSAPHTTLGHLIDAYTITARKGLLAGHNTSGNTKYGNEFLAIEDSGGNAALGLGHTSGRYWTLRSESDGSLTVGDQGSYGVSNGVGERLRISIGTPTGYSIQVTTATGGPAFGVTGSGHVVSSGTTPGIACDAGTPNMLADSNDMSGEFVGGVASANCTVTFAVAWSKKPRCWCQDGTNVLALKAVTTTTQLVCTAAVTIGTDAVMYGCQGAP